MNPSASRHRAPSAADDRHAFTLTELLAILAIVAVLASVQMSALAGATSRTKRAQCAANLRQVALALQIYGGEFNDRLPVNSGAGSWLWDAPWNTGTLLDRYGASWKVMYCPGTAPRFTDADNYRLYNYSANNIRVVGYALTLSGTAALNSTNANPTLTPQAIPMISTTLAPPLPAKRVLVADASLTLAGQSNPNLKSTYNWTSIRGGYSKAHTSPHLSGIVPAGGNVVMLDAHVEWRTLDLFLPRTTGSGPVFWW